jgi:hypothetical protein
MRFSFVPPIALLLGVAIFQPAFASETPKPFQLTRMARASAPGLHIRVVDPAGTLAYPVPVAVEYDSGAPVRAQATADGLTVPADAMRTVRAVTLGGQSPQRFDIDASRANFLVFSR